MRKLSVFLFFLLLVLLGWQLSRRFHQSQDLSQPELAQGKPLPTPLVDTNSAVLLPGQATVYLEKQQQWQPVTQATPITVGARVKTNDTGTAEIVFADESVLALDVNTVINLKQHQVDDQQVQIQVFQELGNTWSQVEKFLNAESSYEVQTQTSVTAVQGTSFGVLVDQAQNVDCVVATGQVKSLRVKRLASKQQVLAEKLIKADQVLTWPAKEVEPMVLNELKPQQLETDLRILLWVKKRRLNLDRLQLLKSQAFELRQELWPPLTPSLSPSLQLDKFSQITPTPTQVILKTTTDDQGLVLQATDSAKVINLIPE
ncbi:MAG: hypothetical protein GF390_02480 [Candidatus Pacebacteria bacterium]|nr:hypothetical protein [Candidatus Paceibacterota bacterium]